MTWTLTTSGSAVLDAGTNANSTITASGSALLIWSNQAEGKICAEGHYDFVTNYSALDTEIKNALDEVCSALIAKKIVSYDPSGYSSVREAETILDVLDDTITKGMNVLKDKVNLKFPPVL